MRSVSRQSNSFTKLLLENHWLTEVDTTFAMHMCAGDENQYLFLATLMMMAREGHVCMPLNPDLDSAIPQDIAEQWKDKLQRGAKDLPKGIIAYEGRVYLERNFFFEKRVRESIDRLLLQESVDVQVQGSSSLNEKQHIALVQALSHPISIISGGPGTGKTYVAKELVQAFLKQRGADLKIVITAPTGKAVSHLETKVGLDCAVSRTLHALLGIKRSDDFARDDFFLGVDFIIVDECSMIDLRLFSALLLSIPEGCHVVLMGDKDQLPPVETGSVFADICKGKFFPQVHLDECMRLERKELLELASAIKQGDLQKIEEMIANPPPGIQFDFSMPSAHEFDSFPILTPMREGPFGVKEINRKVHANQDGKVTPIIITKTDYKMELFNGQVGYINDKQRAFFDEREIPVCFLPPYEYAYALSIHKSQGCEYDKVIVLVPEGTEVFGREILYTAVTRARREVVIRGNKESFFACLRKKTIRHSGL